MARDNVKFSYGGVVIYLATINEKENYINALTTFTIPTDATTPNTTSIVNLNKMEDRFTFRGYLSNGKLNASETYSAATDKKIALKTMFAKGKVFSCINSDGETYTMACDKYEIDYKAMDDKDSIQDGVAIYDVVVSCIVGTDVIESE